MELIKWSKGRLLGVCCVKAKRWPIHPMPPKCKYHKYCARGIVHIADVAKIIWKQMPFDLDYTGSAFNNVILLNKKAVEQQYKPDFANLILESLAKSFIRSSLNKSTLY